MQKTECRHFRPVAAAATVVDDARTALVSKQSVHVLLACPANEEHVETPNLQRSVQRLEGGG